MCSLVFVWIISKSSSIVTVSPFAVIELRITKAATRVHQMHFRATCKKRDEEVSLFFSSCYGKKIRCLNMYVEEKGVRKKVKTFRKLGGCQFFHL